MWNCWNKFLTWIGFTPVGDNLDPPVDPDNPDDEENVPGKPSTYKKTSG